VVLSGYVVISVLLIALFVTKFEVENSNFFTSASTAAISTSPLSPIAAIAAFTVSNAS